MYAKRQVAQLGQTFTKNIILGVINAPVGTVNAIIAYFKSRVDMFCGYNSNGVTRNSAQLNEEFFHELTHAAHYNKVGNYWYSQFVAAEFSEIILGPLSPGERPYGDGTANDAGYVGLGESWAYYMGHVMTDRKYGAQSPEFIEQGIGYNFNSPVGGLSSNLNLLEDFSPLRTNDPFRWIPQGLYYDLFDTRNESGTPIIDNVSNYTIQQMFDAIDSDITTIPQYRFRLLQENNNNQAIEVTNLFAQYNY